MFREPDFDAVLEQLTHTQYRFWQAYYRCQPFGDMRADLRMAKIVAAFQGGDPLDYMPFLEQEADDSALEMMQTFYQ